MRGHACYAILLLACALVHAAKIQDVHLGGCPFESETLSVGEHTRQCMRITCHENGAMSVLACPLAICQEGQQIGYQETDFSKPYPACCARPICKT